MFCYFCNKSRRRKTKKARISASSLEHQVSNQVMRLGRPRFDDIVISLNMPKSQVIWESARFGPPPPLNVRDKDLRCKFIFPPVLQDHRVALLVLRWHDIKGMQHRRAIDEDRCKGEVTPGTDPGIKSIRRRECEQQGQDRSHLRPKPKT